MLRIFLLLLIISVLYVSSLRDNMRSSCVNLILQGSTLNTMCLANGRYFQSSIDLDKCIGVRDGILVSPGKNYSSNCLKCSLDQTVLNCECFTFNQVLVSTSIDLHNVLKNEDGRLTCL